MTKLDSQAAPAATAESNPAESLRPKRRFLQSWRDHPVLSYYLLLVITWLLFAIGLITVFSAATIAALDQKSNPFLAFGKRSLIYLASLAVMFAASRIRAEIYKRLAWYLLGASWLLQALVFLPGFHGVTAGGNTNWLVIPGIGFSIQPSEFMKLALVIFLGAMLSDSRLRHKSTRNFPLYSIGGAAGGSIVLVMIGRDLGTAMVMSSLILVAFFIAGIRLRHLAIIVVCGAGLAAVGVMSSPSRRRRVFGFVDASTTDPTGVGYQRQHGLWSLATGGLTGVGPGASREKWSYLPEADTDYIFAILGEEFGLAGTFWVLTLFILLCLTLTRMMRRSTASFEVYTLAGIMGWFFSQAIINIGAVVGLLPIIGVPLPLISSGGSSMLSVMGAIGVALSFARHEPGAQEALQVRLRPVKRSLAILAGSSVKFSKSRRIKR
ncbi:cell division protein FtsW [Mobiluncus mulieris]|uniref:Probable peptidoglycan glycosyltransferase FtsW n=1 Tax=Mobiluncus mulieris TaxID=2052 RepID=A0A8G2HTY4_9ACTO|nr:putative peptidoglycan glycosyltransferase FtsW [Mobiluncus mulieris]MBB5846257.1 cell division protein FtsW [Mobiluncus mulieris]STO17261.1 Cell division protein FtsW [Mobiluncus mulieris]